MCSYSTLPLDEEAELTDNNDDGLESDMADSDADV